MSQQQQNQQQNDNQPQSQAIVVARNFLTTRGSQLEKWVPAGVGVSPDALIRHALREMSLNEELRACTPESIYAALLCCAVTGLIPGSIMGEAYLVPFWNKAKRAKEAKFIAGWRGLQKQAFRSGVKSAHANVVFTLDRFELDEGTTPIVIHRPVMGNRGELGGAYAWAKLGNDELKVAFRDMAYLEKVRIFAEEKGSPAWKAWPHEMAAKTAMRYLLTRVPMGADFFAGVQVEDAQGRDDGPDDFQVLDSLTDGDATRGAVNNHPTNFQSPGLPAASGPAPTQPPAKRERGAGGKATAANAAPIETTSQPAAAQASPPVSAPAAPSAPNSSPSSPSLSTASPEAASSTATPMNSSPAIPPSQVEDDFDEGFEDEPREAPAPVSQKIAFLNAFKAWCASQTTLEAMSAERGKIWNKRKVDETFSSDDDRKAVMEDMKSLYSARAKELGGGAK